MLQFAFEFEELLRERQSTNRRHIVKNTILLGVDSKDPIGIGSWVLAVLRESNQPTYPILLEFIFDLYVVLNCRDDWLHLIALSYSACLDQNQVSELLRKWSVVFTKIVYYVEMGSGKFDDLLNKGIVSHALSLSFRNYVSFPQYQCQHLEWVLEFSSVMHVSEWILGVWFCKRREIFHYEV